MSEVFVLKPEISTKARRSPLLAFLLWSFDKTVKVSGAFSLILVNPAPKKQFANLGQASAFFLCDLRKGTFDLAGDSESNPLVFSRHKLPRF